MKDKRFILMLKIIDAALIVLMACVIAMLVILPFVQDLVIAYFVYLTPTLIFSYVGGALIFWFFFELKALIATVRRDTAFITENVKRLKHLSLSLLFLALDFGYVMFYIPAFSVVLCMIILVLGVFCARILAYLIQKAIEYKEDVDLTV
jgi:hypothetical protein